MRLLFIHGLVGHMRAPEIEAQFGDRALIPNLLGYGEHAYYEGEISLPAQVEFLHAMLHEHGIERAHLVGHSVGGAIAMLFARQYPNHTDSVISVEGNFTLRDAFWSLAISEETLEEIETALLADRHNPEAWLQRSGVEPTPARIEAARSHLQNQPAFTMQCMARSVVDITRAPKYFDDVMTVLNNGTPVRLIAGERSRAEWDVPEFLLDSAEMTVLANTGHLMTIESPQAFADAVAVFVHA